MAILYQFGSYLYAAVSTCHIGLSISRSASDVSKKVYTTQDVDDARRAAL